MNRILESPANSSRSFCPYLCCSGTAVNVETDILEHLVRSRHDMHF